MVVLAIMSMAMGMFVTMVVATARQGSINRENAIAAEAARVVLERMRGAEFAMLFALYNHDPDDDPGGPGTAPGPRFAVSELDSPEDAPDVPCGEIVLPEVPSASALPLTWQLREDVEHAPLGLPRDLSGDGVVDGADHRGDYILLPIEVRVRWQGELGPRSLVVHTMLTETRP